MSKVNRYRFVFCALIGCPVVSALVGWNLMRSNPYANNFDGFKDLIVGPVLGPFAPISCGFAQDSILQQVGVMTLCFIGLAAPFLNARISPRWAVVAILAWYIQGGARVYCAA